MSKHLILILLILFYACQDDDLNPWDVKHSTVSEGTSYEVLDRSGDFELFLSAVERAGYTELIKGKGLSTLFAVPDNWMKKYLERNNYPSIDAIHIDTLKQIIGMHFVVFPLDMEKMMNFRENPNATHMPGLQYKHKSYYARGAENLIHPQSKAEVTIYHREKFLPLFSTNYWRSSGINSAQEDYQYFFPDANWYQGDSIIHGPGFGILEYAIPVDNGYLYYVDDLIDQMPMIYEVLEGEERFSEIKKICDRFADIAYDRFYTPLFASSGDSLYGYLHMDTEKARLQNIAFEWSVISNIRYDRNSADGITAFMPNNTAMNDYWSNFKGFDNYSELPALTAFILLQNHLIAPTLLFPSVLESGYATVWGDLYPRDILDKNLYKKMCSNGIFYEIENFQAPQVMKKNATKHLFLNPNFEIYANLFFSSDQLANYSSINTEITSFIVPDSVLEVTGNYMLNLGNPYMVGDKDEKLERIYLFENINGTEERIDNMLEVAKDRVEYLSVGHLINRGGIKKGGTWFETLRPNTFVKIDQDTIYSESMERVEILEVINDESSDVKSEAYVLNGPINAQHYTIGAFLPTSIMKPFGYDFRQNVINYAKGVYSSAGSFKEFENSIGIFFTVPGDIYTNNKDKFPKGEDSKIFDDFMNHYLIGLENNPNLKIVDVLNGDFSGELNTLAEGFKLKITPNENGLSLERPDGKTVNAKGPYFALSTIFYVLDDLIYTVTN